VESRNGSRHSGFFASARRRGQLLFRLAPSRRRFALLPSIMKKAGRRRVLTRAREITDALGGRIRVGMEAQPSGAVVTLARPDLRACPRALLDGYGAEILWGFIMAARLAGNQPLADECTDGACATRLRFNREPRPAIAIIQAKLERPFEIPSTFWDQLYAELSLVIAHLRAIPRLAEMRAA
jgi:hypothetical protein